MRRLVALVLAAALGGQLVMPAVASAGMEGLVGRLYREILGRAPGSGEVEFHVDWLAANPPMTAAGDLVEAFFASAEFRASAITPAGYVALLYRAILGREPEPAGQHGWLAAVVERYNALLPGFVDSIEFRALRARTSTASLIERFYLVILGRAAGADEVAAWAAILAATGDVTGLARGFLNSPEYLSQPRTFGDYVRTLYRAFLDREPSAAEVDAWVDILLAQLAGVQQAFVGSLEFQGEVAAALSEGSAFLTQADVQSAVTAALSAVASTTMVVAVVDRMGNPLAVFRQAGAPATVAGNFGTAVSANELAVSLARTGAFFSNGEAPLSSRTVRFISGIHFPPGIKNKANAALYGIENTNRGCALNTTFNPGKTITPAASLNGLPCSALDRRGCGLGIATGKADVFDTNPNAVNPGGIPIFKDGIVVGGIGVAGVGPDAAEYAALVGSILGGADARFGPRVADPGAVILEGVELPFVLNFTQPPNTVAGLTPGGGFVLGPSASPLGALGVPDGWLVGPLSGNGLSAAEVIQIVHQAFEQANRTRAAIRLPLGRTTRMMIAVADLDGNLIGLFRMSDATIFSIDVSVAKARNVVYFSGLTRTGADLPEVPFGTAVTNRTISFGAQPLYPPGIDGSGTGPFLNLYLNDVATPCSQGFQAANVNQSGIVFFPGSTPLWRGGRMVGGLGVSGDGVEQDDLVTAAGATGFAPPFEVRADEVFVGGIRLPYLKFTRNLEEL